MSLTDTAIRELIAAYALALDVEQANQLVQLSERHAAVLQEPIPDGDIEIKPDGIIYLPEIKYRRILNRAFGPGAWGLAPRGETIVTSKAVTREYALVVEGR